MDLVLAELDGAGRKLMGKKFHISVDRDKHFSIIRQQDLTEFLVF